MTTQFLISFSIIMMMLSLVSERASNFVKLYFQGKTIYIPFLYKLKSGWITLLEVKLEILAYKQPTEAAEKEREYRLMVINILIGILIATLANANLFDIVRQISSGNAKALSITGFALNEYHHKYLVGFFYMCLFLWSLSIMLFSRLQEYNSNIKKSVYKYPFLIWILMTVVLIFSSHLDTRVFEIELFKKLIYSTKLDTDWCFAIVTHTLGYIFVGLFLSLGSKFWHDLLDVLFKLKNTQQVLSDSKTYTNYDSADKLMALAETSQYEIAERLYEIYKKDINAIENVVSHGLTVVIDEKTKLYKKFIEVEFTSHEAQGKLERLKYSGSFDLNYNTFYLKDYLEILYTDKIEALNSIGNIGYNPICYAYNTNNPNNMGSFSVFSEGNRFFAVSNLHVFADAREFLNFKSNPKYVLQNLDVNFIVGNNPAFSGTIQDGSYQFGNIDGYGIDLCICEINIDLFNTFNSFINVNNLTNVNGNTMKMFGAWSKYVDFTSLRQPTLCTITYSTFREQLFLIKIKTSDIQNISKGDSGAAIYYKIIDNGTQYLNTGILVAKSKNYAYMFRFNK